MDLIDNALIFATKAHSGQLRKDGRTPYILHPAEVASIAATLTTDDEVIAACLLHDTVEDTDVTIEQIESEFGAVVAAIVAGDTEEEQEGVSHAQSWYARKEKSLKKLMNSNRDVKILWLSDKLSNIRSIYRMILSEGDAVWQRFNQKDKNVQSWYYHTIADLLEELKSTAAYREYVRLVYCIFDEE